MPSARGVAARREPLRRVRSGALAYLPIAALAFSSASAFAGDWKVHPGLEVQERFSDNLGLSADKDSGFVTRISPGVQIDKQGGRVKAQGTYSLDTFFYHGFDRDPSTTHNLDARLNAEIVDSLFYIDANASTQRSGSSLLGVVGIDQSTEGNFSEIYAFSITPSLRFRHRNQWLADAGLTTSYVHSGSDSLSNSLANRLSLNARSGSAFDRLGWSASYSQEVIDYTSASDVDNYNLNLGVSYRVRPRLRALANIGYEDVQSNVDERVGGSSWSLGALWTPTMRTSIQATAGHRFYGPSYGLELSHRTRQTIWSASYSEQVTSTRSQFEFRAGDVREQLDQALRFRFPDPVERAEEVERLAAGLPRDFADQRTVFSSQVYLEKNLRASFLWNLPKHAFVLSAFNSIRDVDAVSSSRSLVFGTSDFNISRIIKQAGLSGTWSWRWMPRTSLVSTVSQDETDFTDIDRVDKDFLLSFGLFHQLSRYTSGSLEFRRQQRDSNGPLVDYNENSVAAGLRIQY